MEDKKEKTDVEEKTGVKGTAGIKETTRNLLVFLAVSGGIAEYYSLFFRNGVFVMLQPGNVIQMILCAVNGSPEKVPVFLWPVLTFAAGVSVAELFRIVYRQFEGMRWQQTAILLCAVDFGAVGMLNGETGRFTDIMLAFTCGIITGVVYRLDYKGGSRLRSVLIAIAAFLVGMLFGRSIVNMFAEKAIWCCCLFMPVIYYMMTEKKPGPSRTGQDELHK